MRIKQIFKKDIARPINGVVKADQLDEASVWQELDEFVVTRELRGHLDRFFQRFCESIDEGEDPEVAERIGVWVSGFFGSGKSHFIKVLSYLLANKEHTHGGTTRRAIDFFESKVDDALLFGNIQRAVAASCDVILFNIDSKADSRSGRDAILAVFLKVLNEMQDFSGDHAHIAHMERYLSAKGQLGTFQEAYCKVTGTSWLEERDAYQFNRDQVVEALATTLGQSRGSCEKWIDGAEESFTLTVENFAKWVREYLDSKGPAHRIIFFVDEVGQFIGSDTHLMLNLQTITEELGTLCQGRAWVVVTSQEDIDAVLGEVGTTKGNDFSKIQGRFKTRLSLSSSNVDEVIQQRLLAKREDATAELEALFAQKGDVIRNQLTFHNVGMTFRPIRNADDFVTNYPFVSYQFRLLQKIFESIRKAGATGLHLARGERSLLDAFQSAGKAVADEEVGVAIPLYLFYPSIESFLDTAVKLTIDQARDNASLEPFDAHVLEVLFLIRYVDELKGNLDNLVTLCLDTVDADRLALRRAIETSLQRLERETLISRSGENYFFLTHEERDINREVKNFDFASGEDTRLLGELIFSEVLRDQRKHRYAANKMDFPFNRTCDLHPVGNRLEDGLMVSVITPLADEYGTYKESRCLLDSSIEGGQVLIRLEDHPSLGEELRTFLKTDKYLKAKDDGTLLPSTKRIHRDLAEENRERRTRLALMLGELVAEARYFINGKRFDVKATNPISALDEALKYLVGNTFGKMDFLESLTENPPPEIQAIVRSDDVAQQSLKMDLPASNPRAIEDLRQYMELATRAHKQILLSELIQKRYANRPYGWPNLEVVLLLARLYAAGEIRFQMAGTLLSREQIYDAISAPAKWQKIVVHLRASTRPEDLQKARQLGNKVFAAMGPDSEEPLYEFLRSKAESWQSQLAGYKALAETGKYPGLDEITEGLSLLRSLLSCKESNKFLARCLERRDELLGLAENFNELSHFYGHQRSTWEKLRAEVDKFEQNRLELDRDDKAQPALMRMQEILTAPSPYALIHETTELLQQVSEVNEALLTEARAEVLAKIDDYTFAISLDLGAEEMAPIRSPCQDPLDHLRQRVTTLGSLAHIAQAQREAQRLSDAARERMEQYATELAQQAAQDGKDEVAEPRVKHHRVIEPARLVGQPYLETSAEVEKFLGDLKGALEAALEADERIEIR